jgi:hypothetical protein
MMRSPQALRHTSLGNKRTVVLVVLVVLLLLLLETPEKE